MNSNGAALPGGANGAVVPPCAKGDTVTIGVVAAASLVAGRAPLSAGFGVTTGAPGAEGDDEVGTTFRTDDTLPSSPGPSKRRRLVGGSTTQEKEVSNATGRFSSGTKGTAVADETRRLTNGGGTGGQLPPAGGEISPPGVWPAEFGGV